MGDIVNDYLEARAAFATASKKVDDLAGKAQAVASALARERGNFMFSNSGAMPMEVGLNPRHKSMNAHDWPSADQIQDALREWHETKSRMTDMWMGIPTDIQGGLQPPLK